MVMNCRLIFRVSLLLVFAAAACLPAVAAEEKSLPAAPAWQLLDLDGKTIKDADFKGKIVVLNFWATWCVPCREEIPSLIELHQQYGDDGVIIVGASVDRGGVDLVKRFVQRFKINYPIVIADEKMMRDFGNVEAVPTTFLIDRNGRVAGKHVGFAEKETLEREIKSLL